MKTDWVKDWFLASELIGLPGVATTVQGINYTAKKANWQSRPHQGRGGGREYHISSLPAETRTAIALQQTNAALAEEEQKRVEAKQQADIQAFTDKLNAEAREKLAAIHRAKEESLKQFHKLPEWRQKRAEAKFEILKACTLFLKTGDHCKIAGIETFINALHLGQVAIPEWVEQTIKLSSLHQSTIRLWYRLEQERGMLGLADHYGSRRGTGKIDVNPHLQGIIIGLLEKTPHIKPLRIQEYLAAMRKSGREDLPEVGCKSIERWLKRWIADHQAEYLQMTNPDAFKNQYMVAAGDADEKVTELNQLWEMDSTPADLMFPDGRYCMIACIDVYSRRMMFLIAKTSKATAIAALLRRCLIAWGVPKVLKTDNGTDYKSKMIQRVVRDLSIRQEFCPPFSPERKPFVERGIGTFSHDLIELKPNYIGHNVAERQAIEARRTFAARLMKHGEVIQISTTAEEFQLFADEWAEYRYARRIHSSLQGRTPFQMAAEWTGELRRIADERALDLLISEEPKGGGDRMVRKDGLMIENKQYLDPHGILGMYVGQEVFVMRHALDMGRVLVYRKLPEGGMEFLCEAHNEQLMGVNKLAYAMAMKAVQKRFLGDRRDERKEFKKLLKHVDIGQAILDHDKAQAGTVVAFPRPAETHETPALSTFAEAAKAVEAAKPMTPERIEAESAAAPVNPDVQKRVAKIINIDSRRQDQDEDTLKENRFKRWLEMRRKKFEGLSAEDERWRTSYEATSEFQGRFLVWQDFDGREEVG